jgi:ketosteroid isomerase-like protein
MTQTNADTIRGIYEAFARQDIPAVMAGFAPDIEWDSPSSLPWGGLYRGHDEVGSFFGKLAESVEEIRVEPERYVEAGDEVIVVGSHYGRARGGGEFEARWAMFWRLRDGKAIAFREHVDTLPIAEAAARQTA